MLGEHDENITPIEDHHLYQKAVTVPPTTMAPNKINSIHWFRKGLRLHDNPSLLEAARGADTLRCVYFLDPWFAGASNLGVNRWRFLLQCLEDLDTSLRKLNSRLFVIRGQPANIFPRLFQQWDVTRLTFESDSEPFGKDRDAAIKKLAAEAGVDVITRTSHTLYDLDKIIELNEGQPPVTFKRFQTLVSSMPPPDLPVEPLTRATMGTCVTPVTEECRRNYSVPHLEELGFDTEGLGDAVWPGGETEALARIERQLGPDVSTAWQMNFERPQLSSNPLLPSNLGLSPYLRFGCLSCRLFYSKLAELYKKVKPNGSLPASLCDKLLWRDFFYAASTNNPRFDRMDGNPICIRIPWDKNPEALAKWTEARTGFPWIDAIMTQLRQEGWIHHLARHAVACFLTRGDLWISWEEGMKVFEELLLDADWSVNAGSWMSHSCSSFFQQFFHCYCPVGTGKRIDPNGDYIRRYLPVLRNFPDKYIYDPWNAPEEVQRDARCMVGEDYPKPMVNHAQASRLNIERMRQIYQQLSRCRGLSLLAAVPSGPIEDLNVNRCCCSTTKRPCGANVHQGRQENPSGLMRSQRETINQEACQTGISQKFAVPQNPGALTRGGGHSSLKRQRESEHDVGRDTDSFSAYKVQRQSKQKEVGGQEQLMTVSS